MNEGVQWKWRGRARRGVGGLSSIQEEKPHHPQNIRHYSSQHQRNNLVIISEQHKLMQPRHSRRNAAVHGLPFHNRRPHRCRQHQKVLETSWPLQHHSQLLMPHPNQLLHAYVRRRHRRRPSLPLSLRHHRLGNSRLGGSRPPRGVAPQRRLV